MFEIIGKVMAGLVLVVIALWKGVFLRSNRGKNLIF